MKENILITGAGGAVGRGLAKSLRIGFAKKVKITGTDCLASAPSFYTPGFFDKCYLVPKFSDKKYLPRIFSIVKKENIGIIFPATDQEALELSKEKNIFEKIGVKVIVSPVKTVQICNDKLLTYTALKEYLPMAQTFAPDENLKKNALDAGFPLIVKPRFGWGSRGILRADSFDELEVSLRKAENPVVQKYLNGNEYTVDGLVSKSGKIICIVPRRRVALLAGLSSVGHIVNDKKLVRLAEKLTEHLSITGPFNFQVKEENGKYFIFEINPRFAGTGILSVMAGANIPVLAVKDFMGEKFTGKINIKTDLMITRYVEDVFISKKQLIK